MELSYTTFRLSSQEINESTNDAQELFMAGNVALLGVLHFDTDQASDTYNHWILSLELISDTVDIPERSLTLYPNTLHFEGDTVYTVAITSELEEIGHDDLQNVFITIGVPVNE